MIESDGIAVFGIAKARLRPIVESAVGEPIGPFEITVEHRIEGYQGRAAEKLIPTFSYVTPDGRRGRITIFVKHLNGNWVEHEQYRFLSVYDLPIPRLYGDLRSLQGRPVLFLEFVDGSPTARAIDSSEQLIEFLSLRARLNAVRPTPEYAAWLEREKSWLWREECVGRGELVEAVWEDARRGNLGEELQQYCSENSARLPRLCHRAEQVAAQAADMDLGLVHGDFRLDNTGRRRSGERVLLDLEDVSLRARFFDIVHLIGPPEDCWPPADDFPFPAPCPPPQALAKHYLREYARRGGPVLPLDQFLAEVRLLWLHWRIGLLALCQALGHADSGRPEDYRDEARLVLLRDLRMLLDRYC